MFFESFKIFILSIILIFCIHNLYFFFKKNLTIPKVRDFVHKPLERYKEIDEIINKKKEKVVETTMKDELKDYIQNLSNDGLQFENITSNVGFNQYESI